MIFGLVGFAGAFVVVAFVVLVFGVVVGAGGVVVADAASVMLATVSGAATPASATSAIPRGPVIRSTWSTSHGCEAPASPAPRAFILLACRVAVKRGRCFPRARAQGTFPVSTRRGQRA